MNLNFAELKHRATMLHGLTENGLPISQYCSEVLDAIEHCDVKGTAQLFKDYAAANYKDENNPIVRQFHSIRLQDVGVIVLPTLNFGSFFETVTLGPSDEPWLRNDFGIETSFRLIGTGNKPRVQIADSTNTNLQIPLERMATDRVRYKLWDLYQGYISDIQKKTVDLAFDWRNKLDGMAYDLMVGTASTATTFGGAYGAFVTTGTKTSRTYIAKGRVRAANLPTTNDITVGTPSANTKFDTATLTSIIDYCALWAGSFADGELRPTGSIIVPSVDVTGMSSTLTAPTTVVNPIGEQMLVNGAISGVSWKGYNWNFIPDNTLATGTCYPKFTKPIGQMFTKPAFDKDRTERNDDENWEEAWQIRTFQMVIPWPWRLRTARFTYKTA